MKPVSSTFTLSESKFIELHRFYLGQLLFRLRNGVYFLLAIFVAYSQSQVLGPTQFSPLLKAFFMLLLFGVPAFALWSYYILPIRLLKREKSRLGGLPEQYLFECDENQNLKLKSFGSQGSEGIELKGSFEQVTRVLTKEGWAILVWKASESRLPWLVPQQLVFSNEKS